MKKKLFVWVRCSLPRSMQSYAKGIIEAVSAKFSDNRFYILDIKTGKWFMYENIDGRYVRTVTGIFDSTRGSAETYYERIRNVVNTIDSMWVIIWDEDQLPEGLADPDWNIMGLYLKKVVDGSFKVREATKSWIIVWKNEKGGICWQDVRK